MQTLSSAIVNRTNRPLVIAISAGFTLIELSIVLVIIGLIVGGVLVGQDLITAAAVRSQITQIEKYNSAVNTFRNKYGYIPGDMPDPYASQWGLVARGQYGGEGDGNGLIQGICNSTGCTSGEVLSVGETAVFWRDLSTAGFVEGGFNTASETVSPANITGSAINNYLPQAKIGNGNYVYAWSVDQSFSAGGFPVGVNYFGISLITDLPDIGGDGQSWPGITVAQAYNIDRKIDDGMPQTGNVLIMYDFSEGIAQGSPAWSNNPAFGTFSNPWPCCSGPMTPSPTTCIDTGGTGRPPTYSMSTNSGAGINCALSFKMQGAAR
jgi:prepilin-type N-terminal cleavage/methylation domain-containing protein